MDDAQTLERIARLEQQSAELATMLAELSGALLCLASRLQQQGEAPLDLPDFEREFGKGH
jgi:uncharacterized coiled-coil protein SlyX